jgi:hypothetical protein
VTTPRFTLTASETPDPPESTLWADLLRWMVCVMDPDDTRLAFVAGCLSHAMRNDNGLSGKQATACQAILDRLCTDWAEGVLVCQNTTPPSDTKEIQPMVRKH